MRSRLENVTLPSLTPGALFGARWIVGRPLGKSELGVVVEAEDSRQARFAALKVFDSALARDAGAWERFATLSRTLSEVPGDGIARSYDVGTSEGRPFVASERCRFPTLARYVAERGPLAPRLFRETLLTLARALDAAHAVGIVHGNLKPQNVFVSVDTSSWARLTDFGLAELREAAGIHPPRTLGWFAPEVSPAPPIVASDLYVLGLLTFYALSGSPWFTAQRSSTAPGMTRPSSASERARALGGDVPGALDAWFDRALAREPRDRFPNALDMAQAFANTLDELRGPMSANPLSATVPVPEKSPFYNPPTKPPESRLDPNGPTARAFAPTEPVPVRPPPTPSGAPPTVAMNSVPPADPPKSAPNMLLLGLGAFVVTGLALAVIAWLVLGAP